MTSYEGFKNLLPPKVIGLLIDYDAWLVGSACKWAMGDWEGDEPPKDFDIIIPPHHWTRFIREHGRDSTIANFGGLKLTDPNIDVWPDTLSGFFRFTGTKTPRHALSFNPFVYLKRNNP